MARTTMRLTAGTTQTPAPTNSPPVFAFLNAGRVADLNTQGAQVATDVTAIGTAGSLVSTDLAASIVLAAGDAGTLGLTALDLAYTAMLATIATATTSSAAISAGSSKDVVVSINTANITSVTQLKRALDEIVQEARGFLTP